MLYLLTASTVLAKISRIVHTLRTGVYNNFPRTFFNSFCFVSTETECTPSHYDILHRTIVFTPSEQIAKFLRILDGRFERTIRAESNQIRFKIVILIRTSSNLSRSISPTIIGRVTSRTARRHVRRCLPSATKVNSFVRNVFIETVHYEGTFLEAMTSERTHERWEPRRQW